MKSETVTRLLFPIIAGFNVVLAVELWTMEHQPDASIQRGIVAFMLLLFACLLGEHLTRTQTEERKHK